MLMVVQTKQVGIEIKLKIEHNQHYHPTRLIAVQKVQNRGQVILKVTETVLLVTETVLKVTETVHKRAQKAPVLRVVEVLNLLKQL